MAFFLLMNKITNYLYLIGLILLISCSDGTAFKIVNEQKNPFPYSRQMVAYDSLKIPIDEYTNYRSNFLRVFELGVGKEVLAIQNDLRRNVILFDLQQEKITHVIPLKTEGRDLIKDPRGLMVKSVDSIYVIDSEKYLLKRINSKGELQEEYDLLHGRRGYESSLPIGFTPFPAEIVDNKMLLMAFPDLSLSSTNYARNGKVNLILDLESGSLELIHGYPESYHGGVWGLLGTINSRTLYDGDQFVYSFGADPFVYQASAFEEEEMNSFYAGSDYLPEVSSFTSRKPDFSKLNMHLLRSSYYSQILRDEKNKLFYRIAVVSNDNPKSFDDKSISIIILNDKLEKIGETLLPEDQYYYRDIFISSQGLCISNANQNKQFDENFMSFTVFQPVDL